MDKTSQNIAGRSCGNLERNFLEIVVIVEKTAKPFYHIIGEPTYVGMVGIKEFVQTAKVCIIVSVINAHKLPPTIDNNRCIAEIFMMRLGLSGIRQSLSIFSRLLEPKFYFRLCQRHTILWIKVPRREMPCVFR